MKVVIEGKPHQLNQHDVIGAGGEGTVYRLPNGQSPTAVKIYHQPSPARSKKILQFLSHHWQIPDSRIALPLQPVHDSRGQQVIGLTMPLLSGQVAEIAQLASRKHRQQFMVNAKTVANIFIDGGQTLTGIHRAGLVIGDFNDLNVLYRGEQMLFIDVDAWQFDCFGCPVGTEQFLAPELYGIDLSRKPVFQPEHDWYAYAVMLFKSLVLAHPYGGRHRLYHQLTARAQHHLTVFDPSVTYPTMALSPDVLDDDLAEQFDRIFAQQQRGTFPLEVLQRYADNLTACQHCGVYYPRSRHACPACQQLSIVTLQQARMVNRGASLQPLLVVDGVILYAAIRSQTVTAIARNKGRLVWYQRSHSGTVTTRNLIAAQPGLTFGQFGSTLVIGSPTTGQLALLDMSQDPPTLVGQLETATFSSSHQLMYRTSGQHLFRIVSGTLMDGQMGPHGLVERPIRSVMHEHTWFAVKPDQIGDKPTVCGFFQMVNRQMFWLTWEGKTYDHLAVAELDQDESLMDVLVKFSGDQVLIRRLTQQRGTTYLRTEVVDAEGRVLINQPKIKQLDHPASVLHGQVFAHGKLLHATDDGMIQEDLTTGLFKTFTSTQGLVAQGHHLHQLGQGLLVVKEGSIDQIRLS